MRTSAVLAPLVAGPDGPLPALLLPMTFVTGLVDAFSYLLLSHVFVANMTGNVVFLAFSFGGAQGFIWWASLLAIGAFGLGAFGGGHFARRYDAHRGDLLALAAAVQTVFLASSWVLALLLERPYESGALALLVCLLGVAMGMQNAAARALAVPDLTTTVLTLTVTGIFADRLGVRRIPRRLLSLTSMFLGAMVGALLVLVEVGEVALLLAALILAAVGIGALRTHKSVAAWTSEP